MYKTHKEVRCPGAGVYLARAFLRKRIVDRNPYSASRIGDSHIPAKNEISIEEIIVFPNPTTDRVFIQLMNNLIIGLKVFDITGRELLNFQCKARNTYDLDLSSLLPGSYNLQLVDTTGTNYVKQIVLTK